MLSVQNLELLQTAIFGIPASMSDPREPHTAALLNESDEEAPQIVSEAELGFSAGAESSEQLGPVSAAEHDITVSLLATVCVILLILLLSSVSMHQGSCILKTCLVADAVHCVSALVCKPAHHKQTCYGRTEPNNYTLVMLTHTSTAACFEVCVE